MNAPQIGYQSPWGTIDATQTLATGIVVVSTPSHGGVWLSPEREAGMPEAYRRAARQWAPAPWYEEDVDVALVATRYADELREKWPSLIENAQRYMETWLKDRIAAAEQAIKEGK